MTGLLTAAGTIIMAAPAAVYAEEEGPVITVQPEDVEVVYPAGASFHAEVADPERVASWKWTMSDGSSTFYLDGKSASTDTLMIPSTLQDNPDLFFQCTITDKDGNAAVTEPARLSMTNKDEDKPVLYVCDYAIEPGETLNVSETGYGSGTVEFSEDGVNITFTNLNLDNSVLVSDRTTSPALGLMLRNRGQYQPEYYFHVKGDCSITNTYFNPDYNNGGITVNAFFGISSEDGNAPTIVIDGDGKLEINGGSNQIYTDTNLEIAGKMETITNGTIFCDGIHCRNLYIDEGASALLDVNGTAVHTEGDLRAAAGSNLYVMSMAPHVANGPTSKNLLFIGGSLYADDATVDLKGIANPFLFLPYGSYLAGFGGIILAGEGSVNLNHSNMSIQIETTHTTEPFTMNFGGISGAGNTNAVSLTNGSELKIKMNVQETNGAFGISVPGLFTADQSSKADIYIRCKGEASGIEAERSFSVTDADVHSDVASVSGDMSYGIVGGEIVISLPEGENAVYSSAENGIALAADTGERGNAPETFTSDYSPKKIILQDQAEIKTPADGAVSLWGVKAYGTTITAETVFDPELTSAPAAKVIVSAQKEQASHEDSSLPVILMGCCLAGAVWFWMKRRKKNTAVKTEETSEQPEDTAVNTEETAEKAEDTVEMTEETAEKPEESEENPEEQVKENEE